MEDAVECLEKAERYEVLGDVYKLIIPMYEKAREFEVRFDLVKLLNNRLTEVLIVIRKCDQNYYKIVYLSLKCLKLKSSDPLSRCYTSSICSAISIQ